MIDDKLKGDGEAPEVTGRECTRCHTWKPFSEFNKKAKQKYGVNNECRECQRISNRISYLKDGPEKRYVAQKARREANPEQRKAWDAEYRARNPEKIKESARRHYENNPEAKERKKLQAANWAKNNPEKRAEAARRSNLKRMEKAENRIHSTVSRAIRSGLAKGGKEGQSTFGVLGYTRSQLMAHLERQFKPGMTWENYGEWHIDHIIPKSLFHFQTKYDIDFKRCWALENLQPLWASENKKKHAKYEKSFQPSLALGVPA